jgi:hypothetical protein
MAITYNNIVEQMIDSETPVEEIQKAVLTEDVHGSFIADEAFSQELHDTQEDTIGTTWTIEVEVGDENKLVTEDGRSIPIEE